MNNFDAGRLKDVALKAALEVFDTMLSMEAREIEQVPEGFFNGSKIVGSVSFTGEVMGCSRICVNHDFAQEMTCAMLGMERDEIEGDEEIHDVVGEVSNMIGGGVKSHLCDMGYPCQLSIPSITSGSNFTIETRQWAWHECCCFQCAEHLAMVEIFLKSK
jgi:chemotaxis protein CheX